MPKVKHSAAERMPYISASMRAAFKRCRYQWSFRYIRKLEPKISAPPLRYGTLLHTALEHYYKPGIKRGPHPAKVFEVAYEREFDSAQTLGFRDEDGKWHDALSLGVDMLEHYVDHYGKDDQWKVLATEQQFEQPVYDPISGDQIGTYTGVLDLIMEQRSSGNLWIWDHKGVRTIDTSYLAMDDQSSGYWTFGVDWLRDKGILKPDKELMGITFNFLRKAKRDDRPKNDEGHATNKPTKDHYVLALSEYLDEPALRKMKVDDLAAVAAEKGIRVLGDVSAVQSPTFFERFTSFRGEHERELTKVRVAAELQEIALVKTGLLEVLKSPDKQNCKFCDVRDICELHETGSDWAEMMRLIMVPRRPFKREAIEFEHNH